VIERRHHLDAAQHEHDHDAEQQEHAEEWVTGRPGWALRAAGMGCIFMTVTASSMIRAPFNGDGNVRNP
jgi:hypothetical protein